MNQDFLMPMELFKSKEQTHSSQSGFALLMTLVVVSVIISIGISVLDLSVKQVRLSTNAKESEVAFHAANAGIECARYIRRIASTTMEAGGAIAPTCFSTSASPNSRTSLFSGPDGVITLYNYGFSWGVKPSCSIMATLVMAASPTGAGLSLSNVSSYIPGYPTASAKVCAAGERCTILSSHGYNRSCSSATGYGSVEREVLLQF